MHRHREACRRAPRGRRPRARRETPCAGTGRSLSGPGTGRQGPRREPQGGTTAMNGQGKSDRPIVPRKPPNKGAAERRCRRRGWREGAWPRRIFFSKTRLSDTEPRLAGKVRWRGYGRRQGRIRKYGSRPCGITSRTSSGSGRSTSPSSGTVRRGSTDRRGSSMGRTLEENLRDLSGRLHRGAYHAKPVQRVYIPKPDGRQRPIGIPTLEDKIVQRAAVKVLSAVYEADFMGFSYGFRPGRRSARCVGRAGGGDRVSGR